MAKESLTMYYVVFAALMLLLVATVGVSYVHLGEAGNFAVAALIAGVKATLVILYFMHVRFSSKLTWLFAGAGIVWLAIMIIFTLSDYLYRTVPPVSSTS